MSKEEKIKLVFLFGIINEPANTKYLKKKRKEKETRTLYNLHTFTCCFFLNPNKKQKQNNFNN